MAMKIGLGLNPHTLTTENFRFAHQLGVTHIVAHLSNWGLCGPTTDRSGRSTRPLELCRAARPPGRDQCRRTGIIRP